MFTNSKLKSHVSLEKRRRGFTLFIDFLSMGISTSILYRVFNSHGRILDIFILKKIRKKRRHFRFAFIRFATEVEAESAIRFQHGRRLGRFFISVRKARFVHDERIEEDKKDSRSNIRGKDKTPEHRAGSVDSGQISLRPGSINPISCRFSERLHSTTPPSRYDIQLHPNPAMVDWLKRSIVGFTEESRDLGAIRSAIMEQWSCVVSVKKMSSFMFIVTFDEVEDCEAALQDSLDLLLCFFSKVEPWDPQVRCVHRRCWIDIVGLPPDLWGTDNFKRLARIWGKWLACDSDTNSKISFGQARILIETEIKNRIEESCVVESVDRKIDLFVKEAQVFDDLSDRGSIGRQGHQFQSLMFDSEEESETDSPGQREVETEVPLKVNCLRSSALDLDPSFLTADVSSHLRVDPILVEIGHCFPSVVPSIDYQPTDPFFDRVQLNCQESGCEDDLSTEALLPQSDFVLSTPHSQKRGRGRPLGSKNRKGRPADVFESRERLSKGSGVLINGEGELDDLEEARKSLVIGDMLGIVMEDRDSCLQHFVDLRRSARLKRL